jgi:hypothetical protein
MGHFDPPQKRDDGALTPGRSLAVGSHGFSRRELFLGGIGVAGLSGTSTAVYGAAIEPERLVTTTYRLTPPGWNAGRLTVAAIADLHAGGPNMLVEHISRVVDAVNALRPELVVLLGDYVATHRFVTQHVAPEVWAGEFARLAAPLGVWAILGNHDWWQGVDVVRRALSKASAFHALKTGPFCWARATPVSGSPASGTSWRIGSDRANFLAWTICRARLDR